jgi:hypothetical protein
LTSLNSPSINQKIYNKSVSVLQGKKKANGGKKNEVKKSNTVSGN